MALNLPLSQRDRNQLVEKKENLQQENEGLVDANEAAAVDITKLFLVDIPSKKQTDPAHTDVYLYEEELRRLNGQSVIQPLQEAGLRIEDDQPNSRMYINDGRIKIEENSVEIADFPIIDMRGFSKSTPAGTDFNIWASDRHGSTTSEINGTNTFTIDDTNKQLRVDIDGSEQEIDFSSLLLLPQTLEGAPIASTIQILFRQLEVGGGFDELSCFFNESLLTFTITSGTVGSSSTAEVVNATSNDMRSTIGFDTQTQITGRYANNLLNISIDGEEEEIKIGDFRECTNSATLGDNNDAVGTFWSGVGVQLGYYGNRRVGPLFCSGIDNGKEIARSIEAQLRGVGTGGFELATCTWYSDDETFVIYSGNVGSSSAVNVLPASDPLRDVRSFLGFDPPQEEKGDEITYSTLGTLKDHLNTFPNVTATLEGNSATFCHSILYTKESGAKLSSDYQAYDASTTIIYDQGARGLPRLYLNGYVNLDNTNRRINVFETSDKEKVVAIPSGKYSAGELAQAVEKKLNSTLSSEYIVEYDTQEKKFIIESDGSGGGGLLSLLWSTGKDATRSLGNILGFDISSDDTGSLTYTSDYEIEFIQEDYFNPYFVDQFYAPTETPSLPLVYDDSVDEESGSIKEKEYLEGEEIDSTLLSLIQNATTYDNEVRLKGWQYLATLENVKVTQTYEAIRAQRGAYSNHISEADAIITQQTNALLSVEPNLVNLVNLLDTHGNLLKLTENTDTFIAGTDFTTGGTETLAISVSAGGVDRKIYRRPAPLVKYVSGTNQIPGTWTPSELYATTCTFTLEDLPAFSLTNTLTGTPGYSYTPPDGDQQYTIERSLDTTATVLSSNTETYDLSSGDQLTMKIDGGSEQTATIDATSGWTESNAATTSGFVIKAGVNDKIDFEEVVSVELTATLTPGYYDGPSLATEIKTQMEIVGANTYSVDYNSTATDKFTISEITFSIFNLMWNSGTNAGTSVGYTVGFDVSSDDTGISTYSSDFTVEYTILTGTNDSFTITIDGTAGASPIVITQGLYSATTLISEMTTQIAADSSFSSGDFTVTYPASKFRITSTTKGTSSTVAITEGTNNFLVTIDLDADSPSAGGGDVGNIDAVTATEVANVLNADITGVSATDDGGYVRITTISTKGTTSSIEITGGSAATTIGFSAGTSIGENADNLLKVDIDGDTSKSPISLNASASPIAATIVATDIKNKLQAIGTGGYSSANCTFNETTSYQTFTNALRIISGTLGISSAVDTTSRTIEIGVGVNDKINFEETGSVELTVTLTPGFYNGSTLATEIKTQMDSVGSSVYTVVYGSDKMTITSDGAGGGGIFNLLWGSGTNVGTSVADDIAFYNVDKTGSLSYISDGLVKTRNVRAELGFDSETLEPGHSLTEITATKSGTTFSTTLTWTDNGGGSRIDLDIDLTLAPNDTIGGLITTIDSEPDYSAGYVASSTFLLSRNKEKYVVNDGDTLIVDPNSTGDQTFTFTAEKGTSTSGSNMKTRIAGGVNDRLKINLNNLATETVVPNEILINGAIGGETSAQTANSPIKVGSTSGVIDHLIGIDTPLTEGVDYTVNYSTGDISGLSALITGDILKLSYTYVGTNEIILGTQLTTAEIAAKIQQEVRNISDSDPEKHAAFLGFTCEFNGSKFVLSSGTGGTDSRVNVYNAATDDAASDLKLGTDNGGIEVDGVGDFVNNKFATINEIQTLVNATATGFTAGGTTYLKLESTVSGPTSKLEINISSTSLVRLGFDNNNLDPLTDISTASSSSLVNFTNEDIKDPVSYDINRGWDVTSGDVEIIYQSIDDSEIINRKSVITTRLSYIPGRLTQITSRVSAVLSALTSSLYSNRRDQVEFRSNKNTGTYAELGEKYDQIDRNNETIAINNDTISEIDGLL